MNNGQTNPSNQPPVPPEFFTTGVGSNNPEANSSMGDNLDTSSIEWGSQPDHNTQRVGRSALHENELSQPTIDTEKSLPYEMPPDYVKPLVQESTLIGEPTKLQTQSVSTDQTDKINFDNIKTSDILSPASIREIDKAEKKLERDGKIGDFYKLERKMTEVNVHNSYKDEANWRGNQ